ncbi:hypothetical protein As57867_005082, partial [Aphanomyces stellatus]
MNALDVCDGDIAEDLPPVESKPLAPQVPMSYVFDDVEQKTASGIIQLQYHVRKHQRHRRRHRGAALATNEMELHEWHVAARGKVASSVASSPRKTQPVVQIAFKKPSAAAPTSPPPNPALKMIICGPPAGGKGTQCERLVDLFGVVHLSTGDMLRAAIHANSDVGRQAKRFMDVGELVPDSLIVDVILDRLTQPDCLERGWLLDGFPRTQGQAQAMLATGIVPDLVVVLDVPDDEVVSRIAGRRVDLATGKTYHVTFNPPPPDVEVVQRSDDNEETIRVRLATYHTHCDAVVESFEGRESTTVIHIDGMRGKEAATETIQS